MALRTIGAENFDAVVCGDEVARTKPDPTPVRDRGRRSRGRAAPVRGHRGLADRHRQRARGGCAVIGVPHHVPLADLGVALRDSLLDVDLDLLRRTAHLRPAWFTPSVDCN